MTDLLQAKLVAFRSSCSWECENKEYALVYQRNLNITDFGGECGTLGYMAP